MGISSQAMPEGTDRCRRRFAAEVAGGSLRRYHGLWLPWIGLGIRVEEKMAPATATSDRPEEVHRTIHRRP
jgi:hypothetical protein